MMGNDLPEDAIELGHDTYYTKRVNFEGVLVGIYEWHKEPDHDYYSSGFIPFNGRGKRTDGWDVVNEDPLTLSPSLACGQCGHHGFIRNGRWEPC